jgi:hypothetical protein
LKELLFSGRLIDLALAVMALEAAILVALRRRRGAGMTPLDIGGHLLAGALLLLAARVALTGGDHRWILLLLAASFPAHLFDLARRARRPGGG